MSLTNLWRSGRVQRYHSNPEMARHGQTNADHQWGCVALLFALHPDPGVDLIRAVVEHDVDELFGGDLSFHFKRAFPEFAKEHARLSSQLAAANGLDLIDLEGDKNYLWVNLVDRLESFLYMRMHCQEWDLLHIENLLAAAEKLNIKTKIEEIIYG